MSKFSSSDLAKQLLITILATVISILLTFGVSHLINKKHEAEERRQVSMMVIHDIDQTINTIREILKTEESGWENARYVLDHKENIRSISKDTLISFINYLIPNLLNPDLRFDRSNESIFNSSQDSWSTLDDMTFIKNVQKCYDLRSMLIDQMTDWVYFRKPLTDEETYKIVMASDALFDEGSFYKLCSDKLSDIRTKIYIDYVEMRKYLYNYVLDKCIELNESNKFLMNITDKDLKEFEERNIKNVHNATAKEVTGCWTALSADNYTIDVIFKEDHTFEYTINNPLSGSVFSGKLVQKSFIPGKWEVKKDSLYLVPNKDAIIFDIDQSGITFKEEMADSVKSIIKSLLSEEVKEDIKKQISLNKAVSYATNIDATGKKLELSGKNGSLHLIRKEN